MISTFYFAIQTEILISIVTFKCLINKIETFLDLLVQHYIEKFRIKYFEFVISIY